MTEFELKFGAIATVVAASTRVSKEADKAVADEIAIDLAGSVQAADCCSYSERRSILPYSMIPFDYLNHYRKDCHSCPATMLLKKLASHHASFIPLASNFPVAMSTRE